MCGGAIISDIVAPASRSSTRLTANLLWGGAVAGMSKQKKNRGGYRSMPLRSAAIIDLEDEFEADFQDFKDYSDSEDVKRPFAFSASKSSGLKVEIIGGEISRNSEKKPRPEKEQALSCPRCKSTNTKFCYYNNYSLAQPRYFCKNCRRYWTHGGTLRNVPVGGSSRKNKRSSSSSSSSSSINHHHRPSPRNPSFNGVPFMHNLNPQNPNSDRLSSLASAPVPDPDPVLMPSGSPMHELKGFENRFGDLQRPVQDGSTASSRIGFPFEEAATVANFERDCNGFWSGMLYSGGSW